MTPMPSLLARLKGAVRSGDGWTARCPAHDDRRNSLSVHHRHGRWLLKCHAGCGWQAIVDALGADAADLFDDEKRGAGSARPSNNRATAQPATALSGTSGPPGSAEELASAQSGPTGLTLDGYATAKRLPTHFVKSCGLSEFTFDHKPAVRIPYFFPVIWSLRPPSSRQSRPDISDRPRERAQPEAVKLCSSDT